MDAASCTTISFQQDCLTVLLLYLSRSKCRCKKTPLQMKKPTLLLCVFAFILCHRLTAQSKEPDRETGKGSWGDLDKEALRTGKVQWRPMLAYLSKLHQRATHAAQPPFAYEWEDLGPGYVYGNAFGHWDVVHE